MTLAGNTLPDSSEAAAVTVGVTVGAIVRVAPRKWRFESSPRSAFMAGKKGHPLPVGGSNVFASDDGRDH
jgi:hypothetical protein